MTNKKILISVSVIAALAFLFSVSVAAIYGDIDNDGKVNIDDIQACIRAIIGSEVNEMADLNNDGYKNIKDIQEIVRTIVNPASTSEDSPFGMHPASIQNSYSEASDMGVEWHRPSVYMMWSQAQPDINLNIYDFNYYDSLYNVPSEINILANIVPDNPKRNGSDEYLQLNSFLPVSEEKYLKFVKAAIERYDGDGNEDMPGLQNPITYWQVGNEPNDRGEFKDFAQLQKMTYGAIKEVCPECKVLIGGIVQPTVAGGAGEFVSDYDEYFSEFATSYELYLEELNGYGFDVLDFHWYGDANGDYAKIKPIYNGLKAKLNDYGFNNAEIWITEMGAYSGIPTGSPFFQYQTEQQQAADYLKRFVYPLSLGVKKIFPAFGLMEGFKRTDGYFDHTGFIYDGEGSSDLGYGIKKLSYHSYKKMTETLEGSDWNNIEKVQETNGVYIYKFNKSGKNIWVAWNDNATAQTITLDVGNLNSIKITEAVPKYESGKDVTDYNSAFNTETKTVNNGKVLITIGDSPVFAEGE